MTKDEALKIAEAAADEEAKHLHTFHIHTARWENTVVRELQKLGFTKKWTDERGWGDEVVPFDGLQPLAADNF